MIAPVAVNKSDKELAKGLGLALPLNGIKVPSSRRSFI